MKHFVLEKEMPLTLILHDPVSESIEAKTYTISFTILTDATGPSESEITEAQKKQNVSFAKVVTLIDHVLNNSIVLEKQWFDSNVDKIASLQNSMITLPYPSEDCLIAALHCKFNNIVSENTSIDTIKILDTSEKISYNYTMIDEENYSELPSKDVWCGEFSYWDTPWWFRKDICTMDRTAESQEEFDTWKRTFEENNLEHLNVALFEDIEEEFESIFNSDSAPRDGELIEVDFKEKKSAWQPKLV